MIVHGLRERIRDRDENEKKGHFGCTFDDVGAWDTYNAKLFLSNYNFTINKQPVESSGEKRRGKLVLWVCQGVGGRGGRVARNHGYVHVGSQFRLMRRHSGFFARLFHTGLNFIPQRHDVCLLL